MNSKLGMILLGLCLSTFPARAATINAASPSFTHVSAAVSSASNGDTVVIPTGTATWTSTLNVSNNITIQGAGSTSTVITISTTDSTGGTPAVFALSGSTTLGTQRITGIGFAALNANTGMGVKINPPGNVAFIVDRRIDHCKFGDLYAGITISDSFGVSDHNEYDGCRFVWRHSGWNAANTWARYAPIPFDSLHYFFHEDETVTLRSDDWILADGVFSQPWAIRHCSVHVLTGAQIFPMTDNHGDYFCDPLQTGAITTLLYENTFVFDSGSNCYPLLGLRGGAGLIFNNTCTGSGAGSAQVLLREETYEVPIGNGWPRPGCDIIHDTYIFNNTFNGINGGVSVETGAQVVIRPNIEYFTHAPSPLVTPPYPHPLVTGGGPTPTPTPTPTPAPTATPTPTPPILGLSFAAPAGVITMPFTVNTGTLSQTVQTPDPTQGGRASYTFAVPTAGDYLLSALVNCPDDASNSFFINVDAEPSAAMTWQIPVTSGAELRIASWSPSTTPKVWTLTAGTHQLIFRGREANAVLQHITFGIRPLAPESLRVVP